MRHIISGGRAPNLKMEGSNEFKVYDQNTLI